MSDSTSHETGARVPVIVGPTASGKTALIERLAGVRSDFEVISADSRQVYIGMDIGTAKPLPALRKRVPHHLIDVAVPSEAFSAGKFARVAGRAIEAILDRGGVPVVVGGTGFYVRALFDGLGAPAVDPEVHASIERRLDNEGHDALVAELLRVDPASADSVDLLNPVKVVRALTCYYQTGRPYSSYRSRTGSGATSRRPTTLVILPDRRVLYEQIDRRVDAMIAAGLVAEVEGLLRQGFAARSPGMRTLGYAETIAYLEGTLGFSELNTAIAQATRRYAKRQMTWFRNQVTAAATVTEAASDEADDWICEAIERVQTGANSAL